MNHLLERILPCEPCLMCVNFRTSSSSLLSCIPSERSHLPNKRSSHSSSSHSSLSPSSKPASPPLPSSSSMFTSSSLSPSSKSASSSLSPSSKSAFSTLSSSSRRRGIYKTFAELIELWAKISDLPFKANPKALVTTLSAQSMLIEELLTNNECIYVLDGSF